MNFRSFLLSAILLSSPVFASSAPSLNVKDYAFSEIVMDETKEPSGDGYTSSEHRENFWNIHARFGFVSDGGHTYLLARNRKMFAGVLQQLKDAKVSIDGEGQDIHIKPYQNNVPDLADGKGALADVTSLIPSKFAGLNEYYISRNGPNCWNLALYFNNISFSLHETLPQEFKFIIDSPLAKQITPVERLQPGDVLVFRNGNEEVHAAVFLSPDLVATKNGTDETRPYRIMDLNEMAAQYLNVHPAYGMRLSDRWFVVRLSSLDNYVNENGGSISTETLQAYVDLKSLEEKINASMLPGAQTLVPKKEVLAWVKAFQVTHQAHLQSEKDFLSSALLLRLQSLLSL